MSWGANIDCEILKIFEAKTIFLRFLWSNNMGFNGNLFRVIILTVVVYDNAEGSTVNKWDKEAGIKLFLTT